jgi:hypothetical protein
MLTAAGLRLPQPYRWGGLIDALGNRLKGERCGGSMYIPMYSTHMHHFLTVHRTLYHSGNHLRDTMFLGRPRVRDRKAMGKH